MAFYGYTHAIIESMEKYILEHDIQELLTNQLAAMHVNVCAGNDHVEVAVGLKKGKCKYCMKKIAEPIPLPIT